MTLILALDQSTSSTKAVLFDEKGQVVDRAARDHRQIYPQPGWVEHDAEEIWQNVRAVLAEIAQRQSGRWHEVAGLSIANQRETFVAFDRRSGRPLHNAIVWQCRRGDAACRELTRAGAEEVVRTRTGLKLDTYFTAPKLKVLMEQAPDVAARLRAGDAVVGTIDAYLVHRLTGGRVLAADSTNASRTLLFDAKRLCWDGELCGLFNVPKVALPEVRASSERFGESNADGALPNLLPLCGVMGDSQAALFALGCYRPGMVKATFGSGTSVLMNIGSAFVPVTRGSVVALAWVHRGQPTYALEGLINYSSATVAWLKDQLGLIADVADTEPLARAVPDSGGVYLVPAFAGLGAPYWRSDARAALVGLTAFTKKEHVVRAALESIAYQVRDVLTMMGAEAGVTPEVIRADGGATRNALLMEMVADLTRLELAVADVAEASAWGAALAGLLGLGEYGSLEELAALPRPSLAYRPQRASQETERMYDGWLAAVHRVM
ncbi:MAG TPA: glycerol kinase GlpK [Lacipirellulaceae bacterium]|nr:glycerol kinase GlpK [Lacipirellulaceae bacterium]